MTVGTAPQAFSTPICRRSPTTSRKPLPRSIPAYGRRSARPPSRMGPFGPEVLSYHLVRSVLRDTRFQIPPGMNFRSRASRQGPLWDKVVNSLLCLEGDAHHRLRSLTSKAFTPASDPAPARHHGRRDERAGRSGRRRGPLRRRHRHRAPLSRPDHLRAARRAPRGLATVFRCGRTTSSRPSPSLSTSAKSSPSSCARGESSTTTSTTWWPGAGTA